MLVERKSALTARRRVKITMYVTAALSVLIVLLLVVGSDAVTTPTSQCAYLSYYYYSYYYSPLLPSLVPSISSKCLAVINNPDKTDGRLYLRLSILVLRAFTVCYSRVCCSLRFIHVWWAVQELVLQYLDAKRSQRPSKCCQITM